MSVKGRVRSIQKQMGKRGYPRNNKQVQVHHRNLGELSSKNGQVNFKKPGLFYSVWSGRWGDEYERTGYCEISAESQGWGGVAVFLHPVKAFFPETAGPSSSPSFLLLKICLHCLPHIPKVSQVQYDPATLRLHFLASLGFSSPAQS